MTESSPKKNSDRLARRAVVDLVDLVDLVDPIGKVARKATGVRRVLKNSNLLTEPLHTGDFYSLRKSPVCFSETLNERSPAKEFVAAPKN